MAQFTTNRSGTTDSLQLGVSGKSNVHEDLSDMYINKDRNETVFTSTMSEDVVATSTMHDWEIDHYADPTFGGALEGADYSAANASQTAMVRVNTIMQIFKETVANSGTAEAVNGVAGMNKFEKQLGKKLVELRRKEELQYLRFDKASSNTNPTAAQASKVVKNATESGSAGRHTASVAAWAENHVDAAGGTFKVYTATGGAGSTYTASSYQADGSTYVGANAAATVQLTEEHIGGLLDNMFDNGGKPNLLLTPTALKRRVSKIFSSGGGSTDALSQRSIDAMAESLNIAVTSVITDFGFDIAVTPSDILGRFANGADKLIAVDTDIVRRAVLRPLKKNIYDNAGDGKRGELIIECGLQVDTGQGIGVIHNAKA